MFFWKAYKGHIWRSLARLGFGHFWDKTFTKEAEPLTTVTKMLLRGWNLNLAFFASFWRDLFEMVKISDPNWKVAGGLRLGIKKVTLDDLENDDLQFLNLSGETMLVFWGVSTEKRVCTKSNEFDHFLSNSKQGFNDFTAVTNGFVISLKTKHYTLEGRAKKSFHHFSLRFYGKNRNKPARSVS